MILSKKDFLFYIEEDRKANLKGKEISKFEWIARKFYGQECIQACDYLYTLRRLEYTINCSNGILSKLLIFYWKYRLHKLSVKYNILIMPNTVGYGLSLTHFRIGGGIILNAKSIGNYCSANSGVIVGNKNGQESRATIGNHVSLNVGCKIIGKVHIGDFSIVAPNSVVVKDVPEYSVVSGIPAIFIKDSRNIKK